MLVKCWHSIGKVLSYRIKHLLIKALNEELICMDLNYLLAIWQLHISSKFLLKKHNNYLQHCYFVLQCYKVLGQKLFFNQKDSSFFRLHFVHSFSQTNNVKGNMYCVIFMMQWLFLARYNMRFNKSEIKYINFIFTFN